MYRLSWAYKWPKSFLGLQTMVTCRLIHAVFNNYWLYKWRIHVDLLIMCAIIPGHTNGRYMYFFIFNVQYSIFYVDFASLCSPISNGLAPQKKKKKNQKENTHKILDVKSIFV